MKSMKRNESRCVLAALLLASPGGAVAQSDPGWFWKVYGVFYPKVWTCGDVQVTDNGPAAAYDRVVVDFGEIDLGVSAEYNFVVCGVPGQSLTFGMELHLGEGPGFFEELDALKEGVLGGTVVAMRLTDRDTGAVIVSGGRLRDDWRWSCCSGAPEEPTTFIYDWDSDVTPRRNTRYELSLSVAIEPPGSGETVRLRARGGGWK